jgi:D-alanyl-D-alanine carboxypeptidase/D-alanyl-D-alanine-endopeptidase (penicillin-binding protein 4)
VFPELLGVFANRGCGWDFEKAHEGTKPPERWVRAKTGFLTGVVSLAGYAGRADGRVFQFAFIFNGGADEARIRNFFDKILNTLID